MCCFSGPVRSVSSTAIFARPLADGRQAIAYRMTVDAPAALAMVLPLPTPPNPAEGAVTFHDLSGYTEFFAQLDRLYPQPQPAAGLARDATAFRKAPLAVVEVGDFVASFVPRLADFARLDERFRMSPAAWEALPGYRERSFAVFQLKPGKKSVQPMAFTFPRLAHSRIFVPTLHIHDGTRPETAGWDHVIYLQCDGDRLPFRPVEQGDQLDRVLADGWAESDLPAGTMIDPDKCHRLIDPQRHVYRRFIHGILPNRDLMLAAS
ncbi:hypothetical protein LBMAG53_02790 [Planctomycetota bacterium]|nr:hypothetical protein LBMAG53_02790 [Planctomycetota bacterium]